MGASSDIQDLEFKPLRIKTTCDNYLLSLFPWNVCHYYRMHNILLENLEEKKIQCFFFSRASLIIYRNEMPNLLSRLKFIHYFKLKDKNSHNTSLRNKFSFKTSIFKWRDHVFFFFLSFSVFSLEGCWGGGVIFVERRVRRKCVCSGFQPSSHSFLRGEKLPM